MNTTNHSYFNSSALICFLLLDFSLFSGYLGSYFFAEPHWKLTHLLDLDNEAGIATWYSSIKFFCIAAVATLFCRRHFDIQQKSSWVVVAIPLLFLFFSMDEIVQIHESLGNQVDVLLPEGDRKNSFFKNTGIWTLILGVPFLLIFLLWSLSIYKYFAVNTAEFKLFISGMMILLTGALGIETLSNYYATGTTGYVFIVAMEELLEMIGASIIFQSLYLTVSDTFNKLR